MAIKLKTLCFVAVIWFVADVVLAAFQWPVHVDAHMFLHKWLAIPIFILTCIWIERSDAQ